MEFLIMWATFIIGVAIVVAVSSLINKGGRK